MSWPTGCGLLLLAGCATAVHPEAARSSNACARALHGDQLAEASAQCDLSLEYGTDDANLWVNRGLVLHREGRTVEARAAFERALDVNPDALQAHNNLGALDLVAGAVERAIEHFEEALRIDPRFVAARYNLALARERQASLAEARRQLRIALAVDAGFVPAWRTLGLLALVDHEDALAVEAFGQLTARVPSDAEAWLGLAEAEARLGRIEAARAALRGCLRAAPSREVCGAKLGMSP